MFELSDLEEQMCDEIAQSAVHIAVNWIHNSRECDIAEVDNEVRIRMVGAVEYLSAYGPLH